MEKKQTAVSWLSSHWAKLQKDGEKMTWQQIIDITNLALQMERDQIEEAFVAGDERGTKGIPFNAEQYYTQTFKP